MPGTVVAIGAATGDMVEAGHPLVTIEAMKMEHALLAPTSGSAVITVALGDLVSLDQLVATVTEQGSEDPAHEKTGSPET
jgi:acetyl-CoA/propionyl-CoA carboxylase biotin carboxyl carrier protein